MEGQRFVSRKYRLELLFNKRILGVCVVDSVSVNWSLGMVEVEDRVKSI